jgi:hypothetical protein
MLSAHDADKAWTAMTRSFPSQGAPHRHRTEAGKAAYAALLHDPPAGGESSPQAGQWLLLRDRTAARFST